MRLDHGQHSVLCEGESLRPSEGPSGRLAIHASVLGSGHLPHPWLLAAACVSIRATENRYVGFGNTVPPPKREDDFLNSAMSSLYSVRAHRS